MATHSLALLLLLVALALLAWYIRRDLAGYAAFKALDDSRARCAHFRRWLLESLLLFGGYSLVALLLLGRLDAVVRLPPEFASTQEAVRRAMPRGGAAPGFWVGFVAAALGGMLLGAFLGARKQRSSGTPRTIGDVAPLVPRDSTERWHVALLSVNAGITEELFYRVLLPLLATLVTGSPLVAFAGAGLVFGVSHWYQGPAGIVATTLLGGVFTLVYLATGALWIAVAVHGGINLVSLVARPALAAGAAAGRDHPPGAGR